MEMLDCLRESSEPNTFQPGVENREADFPLAHPKWNKKEKNHSLSSIQEDKWHWQESPGLTYALTWVLSPDPATPPCQGLLHITSPLTLGLCINSVPFLHLALCSITCLIFATGI